MRRQMSFVMVCMGLFGRVPEFIKKETMAWFDVSLFLACCAGLVLHANAVLTTAST